MRKFYSWSPGDQSPDDRNESDQYNSNAKPEPGPELPRFILNTPQQQGPFAGKTISAKRMKKHGVGAKPTEPTVNIKLPADPGEVTIHNGISHDLDLEAYIAFFEHIRDNTDFISSRTLDIDAIINMEIPEKVLNQINAPINVTIEPMCIPTAQNMSPPVRKPTFSHVRNYMSKHAAAAPLLWDCNLKDLEVFHSVNPNHYIAYCAFDHDSNPTSLPGANNFGAYFANDVTDVTKFRQYGQINLYYFITKYCETFDRLVSYFKCFSDALMKSGKMFMILPHPDTVNPKSCLNNLLTAQERGCYPKMVNIDSSQEVYSDYYIPLEDIREAAEAVGLVVSVISHDLIRSDPQEAASCSLLELSRVRTLRLTVEQQLDYAELSNEEEEAVPLTTPERQEILDEIHQTSEFEERIGRNPKLLELEDARGSRPYSLLPLKDVASPQEIMKILSVAHRHSSKQPHLKFSDFHNLTIPRMVFAPIPYGVPGIIFNQDEISYFYNQVDERAYVLQPPLFSNILWHVVMQPLDGGLNVLTFNQNRTFKIIVMDSNFPGSLDERLEAIGVSTRTDKEYLQRQIYRPLSALTPNPSNHIIVYDLSHRYMQRDRQTNTHTRSGRIVLRGIIWKVPTNEVPNIGDNPTILAAHDQDEWHLDCDNRVIYSPSLGHPATQLTREHLARRRLEFVAKDFHRIIELPSSTKIASMHRDLHTYHAELNKEKAVMVEDTRLEDLLVYAERERQLHNRSRDYLKAGEPPLVYYVEDMFPDHRSVAHIVQDIKNMDILVATYPNLLSWKSRPSSDALTKLYLIRHARMRMLPPGNHILRSLVDKAIEYNRKIAAEKRKTTVVLRDPANDPNNNNNNNNNNSSRGVT